MYTYKIYKSLTNQRAINVQQIIKSIHNGRVHAKYISARVYIIIMQ